MMRAQPMAPTPSGGGRLEEEDDQVSQNQAKRDAGSIRMRILKTLNSLQALGAETHPIHNHLHLRLSCSVD